MSPSTDLAAARLVDAVDRGLDRATRALSLRPGGTAIRELGRVLSLHQGVVQVDGLPGATAEEVVRFPGGRLGLVLDLDRTGVGVVLLDDVAGIEAGMDVQRTGRVADVPVGKALVGRVVDPAGRPLDDGPAIRAAERWPIERPAPPVIARAPVDTPLQTGVKVVDALVPIGRGQRELVVGDRQTGKTAIAVDAILNQRYSGVRCVYCAIGQRAAGVAKVLAALRAGGAMDYTTVVVATGDDPVGLRFVAPYAAMSIAEHAMEAGEDVLVVLDDLTSHARAYRELSLLLRRPPGREAYPGDIFYVHSRLLERATHLDGEHGGGSLTALPIVETQAGDISAYIPTNLISITDGQVFMSARLFRRGQLPAVDVGRSVSRVGGRAQLDAYRTVVSDLRLAYSQYEELERFTRYGARLEREQRDALERGRRVRQVLRQAEHELVPAAEQVGLLIAAADGLLDHVPADQLRAIEPELREAVRRLTEVTRRIGSGQPLDDDDRARVRQAIESSPAVREHRS